jgi:hypothetical protein
MPVGKGPSWNTPAQIDGLPAKNWKTREGVTMRGTFSACIKRWLDLPPPHRRNCSISWGPNAEGQVGNWERPNIVGFLMRNGPPPEMGPKVTIDHIKAWLEFDRPDPVTWEQLENLPPGHHAGGDGGRAALEAWLAGKSRKS